MGRNIDEKYKKDKDERYSVLQVIVTEAITSIIKYSRFPETEEAALNQLNVINGSIHNYND